jgi:ATP-binding cassette subfamily B protein
VLFSRNLKPIRKKSNGVAGYISGTQLAYLGKYLKPRKKILILSLVLSGLSTVFGMTQPYFAKVLIDKVFLAADHRLLWPVLSLLLALILFAFAIRVINSFLYMRYSAQILFHMREDLFEHVQKIPLNFFSKQKIGDLYSRIASDMADIQSLATDVLPMVAFNLLTCLIAAGVLMALNWKMALLSFAFLPAALIIIYRLRPKLLDLGHQVARSNAEISHFIFESLSNTHMIRAFGAEKIERSRLNEKQSHILGFLMRYQVLGAVSGSIPTVFVILNAVVVFGYGGSLVLAHTLTIGSLVAFSIYQGRVFGPLKALMDGFLSLQKSLVSLARVREILDILPVQTTCGGIIPEKEAAVTGDIEFRDVCFAYDRKPVVNHMSFQIPGRRITAIIGPSGAGKTTLCHLMLRLFDPDSGVITIGGIDLKTINPEWFRKQAAIVSQDIFLFHTTILENIRFPKPCAGMDEVRSAAESACIDGFIQTLPNGYDTVIGDRGVLLSGGQKQRLSIARAVLMKPKILILDEATAFVDVSTEDRLKDTLGHLMEDKTIVIVSHRYSAIAHADRIIALDSRGLAYEGPAEGFAHECAGGDYRQRD